MKIVEMMWAAGRPRSICGSPACPLHSRFYGVDTPTRDQLLAAQNDVDEMARIIGVDSLAFLTMGGLYRAMGLEGRDAAAPQYCDACFSGEYPIAPTDQSGDQPSPQLSFLTQLA